MSCLHDGDDEESNPFFFFFVGREPMTLDECSHFDPIPRPGFYLPGDL